mgnify:CR=1 FL=1
MSQLISFEVAKLAKEKGFNTPCENYFDAQGTEVNHKDYVAIEFFEIFVENCHHNKSYRGTEAISQYNYRNDNTGDVTIRPTQSELRAWLRNRDIHIELGIDGWEDDDWVSTDLCYRAFVWQKCKPKPKPHADLGCGKFENILEIALKEALNLISNERN